MAKYINCDFDNTIIDAVYELILRYFQNNVSYHLGIIDLYNKDLQYDEIGRVIWNYVHINGEEDIEIKIGMSKNYNSYFIESDVRGGHSIQVRSKAYSLGSIVDNISEDILNIENRLIKGIEDGFLI